ncbi:DUF3347 domain-containing protein [Rudanella lutea]|uniref:DUF3347 domain-containing protein n=1 Tax=Rudanella lutea TaxID=451374 RepID=UPI00038143CC|nr:DUF3347 domain-containing protein [Rudanella lutea]
MRTIRLAITALSLTFCSLALSAQSLTPALSAYYSVKDALVATNAGKAKAEAQSLIAALGKVDAAALPASARPLLSTAKTQAAAIAKTSDVEVQRKQFEGLSTNMITLTKATKPGKAYVQYCPMAAGGKGASWLSDKREVRNPYYGDKMLKCGTVKEEI